VGEDEGGRGFIADKRGGDHSNRRAGHSATLLSRVLTEVPPFCSAGQPPRLAQVSATPARAFAHSLRKSAGGRFAPGGGSSLARVWGTPTKPSSSAGRAMSGSAVPPVGRWSALAARCGRPIPIIVFRR
jgi:hypothetical protein